MNMNNLQVNTNIVGGYFSSEQIDLLSIIQCQTKDELIDFANKCNQLNNNYSEEVMPFTDLKKKIFIDYQNTMVSHKASIDEEITNHLKHCGLNEMDVSIVKNVLFDNHYDIMPWLNAFVKNLYPENYKEIINKSLRFVSRERDQIKDQNMYDEIILLNNNLDKFNSILISSGKIGEVINPVTSEFDFYHAKRDLDFAYKNGKQVRYHSLLVKEGYERIFAGKTKEQILDILKSYVKESIDFIANYNKENNNIIKAVDLFNEIVSFNKNAEGNYYNIWEDKYGITIDDILSSFEYAYQNKPDGVSFLYNEPFLEDDLRRKKVLEILSEIDTKYPGLIDTLGSQMHITIGEEEARIKRCYDDFKNLQETTGKKIQITEFDLSIGRNQISPIFGNNPTVSLEQVYEYKLYKIRSISDIINKSGVNLDGITYWSLTDGVDCNLERLRSELNMNIPTACGGLFPTHKRIIKDQNSLEKII